jgi:hypothetical protein
MFGGPVIAFVAVEFYGDLMLSTSSQSPSPVNTYSETTDEEFSPSLG